MNDCDVINTFVVYLRENGHPSLQIDQWPDKENRDSTDIDAIAGPFAIEHTSIDTFPNQRRDSDWFIRAAGRLEQELSSTPPFHLRITLEYQAIARGQDWASIRAALKSWITNQAPRLADGHYVLDSIPGVPFRLDVAKASKRRSGVFFARSEPGDNTLPDRIRVQFDRKAKKLAQYPGKTRILLIENNDIANMNEFMMLDAIKTAYPAGPSSEVDQIWYADTSVPSAIEFRDFTSDLRR
jgi:hypothetical protein